MAVQLKPPSLRTRFEVLAAWGFRCVYCGRSAKEGARLQVDHVIPQAENGSHARDNLVAACTACNLGKGGRYMPESIVWERVHDDMDWMRCASHDGPFWERPFDDPERGRRRMGLWCSACQCVYLARDFTG